MGGSLPFRSGVVVSLRPLSVCHGSLWLVPAFFPSLSLSFPVCAPLQLGWNFLLLPDCPSPYFGLLVYWFLWLLFSTRVTYLRDGVTPAGSWPACPRLERRFSISIWVRYAGRFLAGHPASVCGYLHPGAAGALSVPSLRLRVSESSSLSAWSFPFRGLSLFLAFVPLLEAMSESLTHSFPRSFLVVALYASAVGFADTLWLCPESALCRFFASVSLLAPVALSPLLHRVFPDGFRLWCAFRFCEGASPLALVPWGPLGSCGGSTHIALQRT